MEACVRQQEAIVLDGLVHGEFKPNDMVEEFAEHLEGFASAQIGWVESNGERCVRPPLIYGDGSCPAALTAEWGRPTQTLPERPMEGLLTGPSRF
jgi:5-methyltetrahydropteroyltriglutamate--homocysteine methyltransferase